jgi:hypothetical protein
LNKSEISNQGQNQSIVFRMIDYITVRTSLHLQNLESRGVKKNFYKSHNDHRTLLRAASTHVQNVNKQKLSAPPPPKRRERKKNNPAAEKRLFFYCNGVSRGRSPPAAGSPSAARRKFSATRENFSPFVRAAVAAAGEVRLI